EQTCLSYSVTHNQFRLPGVPIKLLGHDTKPMVLVKSADHRGLPGEVDIFILSSNKPVVVLKVIHGKAAEDHILNLCFGMGKRLGISLAHESINELVRVMGDLQGVLVLPDFMKASPHKVQCMAGSREIRVHIRGLWHGDKNAAGQPVVFQGLPGLYQIRMGTGATGKKQGGGKPANV